MGAPSSGGGGGGGGARQQSLQQEVLQFAQDIGLAAGNGFNDRDFRTPPKKKKQQQQQQQGSDVGAHKSKNKFKQQSEPQPRSKEKRSPSKQVQQQKQPQLQPHKGSSRQQNGLNNFSAKPEKHAGSMPFRGSQLLEEDFGPWYSQLEKLGEPSPRLIEKLGYTPEQEVGTKHKSQKKRRSKSSQASELVAAQIASGPSPEQTQRARQVAEKELERETTQWLKNEVKSDERR